MNIIWTATRIIAILVTMLCAIGWIYEPKPIVNTIISIILAAVVWIMILKPEHCKKQIQKIGEKMDGILEETRWDMKS